MPKRVRCTSRALQAGWLVGCLLLAPQTAGAQMTSDRLFEQALADIRAGNYRTAIAALETAAASDHAGAQAVLAQLLWRGELVVRDKPRALSLATLASQGALNEPWIDDVHQGIYCAASPTIRQEADTIVAAWREQHPVANLPAAHNAARVFSARRTCATGELVDDLARSR